jgi:MFS family permease
MLVVGAAGMVTLGIVQAPRWGWGDPRILGSLTAAAAITPLVVWRSRRHDSPALDLDLLGERQVALGNLGTFLFAIGGFGIILNNVLFLTTVWKYSILMAGLALTPAPIAMALAAVGSGKAADRYGERVVAAPGTILFGLGTLWLANRVGTRPDLLGRWLPGAALTGAGCGLAYPALGSAALARLPAQSYATGSAINAMFRQLGAALGFALIVSVVGTTTGLGAPTAFANGWKLAGLAGAAALVPALGLRRTRPDPNEIALSQATGIAYLPHELVSHGAGGPRESAPRICD